MMRLIFHSGPLAGSEINTGAPLIRMGRHPQENDIVVDDPMASSLHCRLTRSPRGAYILEDLNSTNGTYVNGQRIQGKVYLSAGDRYGIGATEIECGEGRVRLMVVGGPRAGKEIPVGEQPITIGRAPDNDITFEDPDVSGHHAVLVVHPTGFIIQDNGSTNGTFVNGGRTQRQPLEDGDSLTIGNNELRFLIDKLEKERGRRDDDILTTAQGPGGPVKTALSLRFVSGPHNGQTVPLGSADITLGRRPDCTFVIDDLQVSGLHCAIAGVGTHHQIVDQGSRNGTFVNGARIERPTQLKPGDLVEIGTSVAEVEVSGGGAAMAAGAGEVGGATVMASVMAEGAYEVTAQPKFIINGHVESTSSIEIGRSPSCAMRLENDSVSRVQCVISWENDGFWVEDKSSYGTYIGDKRVVKDKLQDGHVLKCGPHLIKVEIRGERCTLEEVDAAQAMAAIEVARMTQFSLKDAVSDPANIGGSHGSAYKTMFKMDVPDADALVREAKAKFKQGAPAWRPSTDIKPTNVTKLAVTASMLAAAAAIAVMLFVQDSDAALMNHPLSDGHASQAFVDLAEKHDLGNGCERCHSTGSGVDEKKCATCHEGFDKGTRTAHQQSDKPTPGGHCVNCHRAEHRGLPRILPSGGRPFLGASAMCTDGCHQNQHSEEFFGTGAKPPIVVKAGPVPTFDIPPEDFHVAHTLIKKDGQEISIGCSNCHGTQETEGGDYKKTAAGLSCFQCHEGGGEKAQTQCLSCHDSEHAGAPAHQRIPDDDPSLARVSPMPSAGGSLLKGGGFTLAVFLPLIGVALVVRARRRSRSEKLVKEFSELPVEIVKRLVHSINTDKCVGCSMCVQACPASVLELVNHKSTVVNFDACIQCKKCEGACAFDALRMHDADKPPPMIQMPDVDAHYQTPVAGMYLIGQASGTPQVKNASNLGRAVVQHMVKDGMRPGYGQQVGAQVDVVIVGSGPAGLSAALSCIQLGLSYVLLEKQRDFSWTIRSYYHKGKEVMAEPNHIEMAGLLPHWDTDRETLLAKWQEIIQQQNVQIQYQQDCTDIKKEGEIFTCTISDGKGNPTHTWTGARVVIAIGTMGNPRKLRCPGDDLPKVFNALVDPDEYKGKNVLVVGASDAGIEVALALCETNKVWLSWRRAKFDRVKPGNLDRINAVVAQGKVTLLGSTAMKGVTDTDCTLEKRDDKTEFSIPNDVVFAMIGGNPPIKWLQSIGVPYVEKPHSWSPAPTDQLAKDTAV